MHDSHDIHDIPFEDSPPSAAGGGAGAKADAGAKAGTDAPTGSEQSEQSEQSERSERSGRSEERTPPGPGSTGPTGVREDLGTLAEEARKLWSAVEARVVTPAVQSYPEVARHLGAAGREVAAALRSVVRGSEQTWRDSGPGGAARKQENITVERVGRIDPPEQKNRD